MIHSLKPMAWWLKQCCILGYHLMIKMFSNILSELHQEFIFG